MLSTPHPPHPTLGFWIRLFWLLNPWLLKIVVVESGVLVVESGFAGCWSLGFWIVWLLKPAFLVAEAMVAESGCFGCWIRLFWLLNPALLVAEALVVECFGCWFRLCWLLKLWLSNPSLWLLNPAFWLLNLSCWIRVGCWIRFCSSRIPMKHPVGKRLHFCVMLQPKCVDWIYTHNTIMSIQKIFKYIFCLAQTETPVFHVKPATHMAFPKNCCRHASG